MNCSFHCNLACKSCNAFIKVLQNDDDTETIVSGGEHVLACATKNNHPAQDHDQAKDCTKLLKSIVEEHATSNNYLTDLPRIVWNDSVVHFCSIMVQIYQECPRAKCDLLSAMFANAHLEVMLYPWLSIYTLEVLTFHF